jgi:hypothetical protein
VTPILVSECALNTQLLNLYSSLFSHEQNHWFSSTSMLWTDWWGHFNTAVNLMFVVLSLIVWSIFFILLSQSGSLLAFALSLDGYHTPLVSKSNSSWSYSMLMCPSPTY